jgi:L-2-hydroxyglutarate oxidase LhgO
MLGCNAYSQWPTKFNGGLFTFDPMYVDQKMEFTPDFRKWGGGTMTAQNQRLVYWPMLKSGDFDLMKSQFDFYLRLLPTAEAAFLSLAPQIGRPNEKEMKAKSFLIEMLQGGEMLSSDCEEKLEAAGFRKSTIKKAKKNAGVISRKKGFLWYWSLPMGDIPRE